MLFPEGLPGHLQMIQATVKPIGHMHRAPPNIPVTLAPATLAVYYIMLKYHVPYQDVLLLERLSQKD